MNRQDIGLQIEQQLSGSGMANADIVRFVNELSSTGYQRLEDALRASTSQPNALLLDALIVYFSRSGFISLWRRLLYFAQSHEHHFRLTSEQVKDYLTYFEAPEDPRTLDVLVNQYFEHLCHPMVTLVLGGATPRISPMKTQRNVLTESSLGIEDLVDGQCITGSYFAPVVNGMLPDSTQRCWNIATRFKGKFRLLELSINDLTDNQAGDVAPLSFSLPPSLSVWEQGLNVEAKWPEKSHVQLHVYSLADDISLFDEQVQPTKAYGHMCFDLHADAGTMLELHQSILAEKPLVFTFTIEVKEQLRFVFCGSSAKQLA
ncbi:hypothetical protein KUL156_48140 [Alteromonas sp. KUL156]|nr:hypothetical protein KUL154_56390 [Alteromonas sp. KUL154]GFE02222.1 hypothetical protein KUL156_48140 [Alteromonas sp. KUL156]